MNELKESVEDKIEECQNSIRKALQKFHDKTGFLPINVTFDRIDVSTFQNMDEGNHIQVSNVKLSARL